MNTQLVRSISILLMGVLFLVLGDKALNILVVSVGVLFMIPGCYAIISYLRAKDRQTLFPLAALGGFLLGFWMVLSPSFFVGIFMYVVGAILVVLGIYQLATLSASRRLLPVAGVLYVFPVLVLLLGLFVLLNPFEAASLPFIIIGVGCVISALNDIIQLVRMGEYKPTELQKSSIEDAEIVD